MPHTLIFFKRRWDIIVIKLLSILMPMEKEDIVLLAQMLHTMRELTDKLDEYFQKKDFEGVARTKRELVRLQKKVAGIT